MTFWPRLRRTTSLWIFELRIQIGNRADALRITHSCGSDLTFVLVH